MAIRQDTPHLNTFLQWAASLKGKRLDVNSIADSLGPSLASIAIENKKTDEAAKKWDTEFKEKKRINDELLEKNNEDSDFKHLELLVDAGLAPGDLANAISAYDFESERVANLGYSIRTVNNDKSKRLKQFDMRRLTIKSNQETGTDLNGQPYDETQALEDYKNLKNESLSDPELDNKFSKQLDDTINLLQKDVFQEDIKNVIDTMYPHLDPNQREHLSQMAVYMQPQDFMKVLEGDIYQDPLKAMDDETKAITTSNLINLAATGNIGATMLLNHSQNEELRKKGIIAKDELTISLQTGDHAGQNVLVKSDGTFKLVDEEGNISNIISNLDEEQKKQILQGGAVPKNFFNSK